jgi:hypothetical protein
MYTHACVRTYIKSKLVTGYKRAFGPPHHKQLPRSTAGSSVSVRARATTVQNPTMPGQFRFTSRVSLLAEYFNYLNSPLDVWHHAIFGRRWEGNPGKCTVILRRVLVLRLQVAPSPLTAHFVKWFTSLSIHCVCLFAPPPAPKDQA